MTIGAWCLSFLVGALNIALVVLELDTVFFILYYFYCDPTMKVQRRDQGVMMIDRSILRHFCWNPFCDPVIIETCFSVFKLLLT